MHSAPRSENWRTTRHRDSPTAPIATRPAAASVADRRLPLEDSFLPLQRPEGSDVRNRERHAELILVPRAELETPELHAESAAIGVVGDLRLRVLQRSFAILVVP